MLALLDADDLDRERCAELIRNTNEPLVVAAPTLVQIDYWIRKRLEARVWTIFLQDIAAGAYRLEHPDVDDLLRIGELESSYHKLGLGMVDAAVIAICERLGEKKVATLDRRHFGTVKPRHSKRLRLLPE